MDIRAISLDLDDTLWPIEPVLAHVERSVDAWLHEHCPEVARAWPIEALRALRDEVAAAHPEIAHDFGAQRRLTLRRAFAPFGMGEDWVETTYAVYVRLRNEVECYADTLPALAAMAGHVPLIAITNGTADIARIGLDGHFRFSVCAADVGVAKPGRAIFAHACERLAIDPAHVLHVGDDPVTDVAGARAAGMRTAWINRVGATWQGDDAPDLEVRDLAELADWIGAHARAA
ncbi:HAD family hydrolase [Dokdonella sp. MW10]|uniref:HAD family hydrolase n=1 Tax=Dokdonella sp. MW10 TaxID=2992926 RepID=UPI003F82071F